MMERVVPMGSSFLGWGTMAMRPTAFLYLQWLPFWETNWKPCSSRTRMTSPEPRRLGVHQLLADGCVSNRRVSVGAFAIEVEFDCLFEVGDRLFPRGAET